MKIKEHGNLFVREDGQTYPFHSFIERSVQGRLASLGLPPFPFFDALTSWPIRGCDDVVAVLEGMGWVVENGKWTPAVVEHAAHFQRGDVSYPFKSDAQKVVAHDLAQLNLPPIDFDDYDVKALEDSNGQVVWVTLGRGGKRGSWLAHPTVIKELYRVLGADDRGAFNHDHYIEELLR
jgi:hypothetical protein